MDETFNLLRISNSYSFTFEVPFGGKNLPEDETLPSIEKDFDHDEQAETLTNRSLSCGDNDGEDYPMQRATQVHPLTEDTTGSQSTSAGSAESPEEAETPAKMVGKKSGKALLREEGLERTDNNMEQTTWPQIVMINQKNYYTEYLKRDDQILSLRGLQDDRRARMTTQAKDRDRARAHAASNEGDVDASMMDAEEEGGLEDAEDDEEEEIPGSRVIVIHLGSQNLRIGLATDALPKTVPMVIARKWKCSESEQKGNDALPKRLVNEDGDSPEPEKLFGADWAAQYNQLCSDLKIRMRANKRRVLPNSKELVVNYNTRVQPELISEHNDPMRIEWTEVGDDPKTAPDFFTGHAALRIPDKSNPRYKLFWPLQYGWLNEGEYDNKLALYRDVEAIIEDAVKNQLDLKKKRDWLQYGVVLVIPDLYERNFVTSLLEIHIRDLGFGKVAFMQESVAATFGAAFTVACVVDIGAQKTSICCVEEGLCIENSRVNIKVGGSDVTQVFMKMMLYDHFPYSEINLRRRYDFLLAEEIKQKHCTMNESEISVNLYDFHLRAPGQDTRKYQFKTYDEILLAPYGLFQPSIFDHNRKMSGRRKLIEPCRDIYEDNYNDPVSAAQTEILVAIAPTKIELPVSSAGANHSHSTPLRQLPNNLSRVADSELPPSAMGSPAPEGDGTPAPAADGGANGSDTLLRDDVLPVTGLDTAIFTSIMHGSRGDERKMRDFLGAIMVIGGGAQTPGFLNALEERLKIMRPAYAKDILISPPPRDLDPQGVVWKGASVFGKLKSTNENWIGRLEFDRVGSRALAYKCQWAW